MVLRIKMLHNCPVEPVGVVQRPVWYTGQFIKSIEPYWLLSMCEMTGSDSRIQQPYLFQMFNTSDLSHQKITEIYTEISRKAFDRGKKKWHNNYSTKYKKGKKRKMASAFLSSANPFLSSTTSSSSSSSSSPVPIYLLKNNAKRVIIHCKASSDVPAAPSLNLTKRSFSACLISSIFFSLGRESFSDANAAILEADDDEELLERVKQDRKKRLERQGFIKSSAKETGLF